MLIDLDELRRKVGVVLGHRDPQRRPSGPAGPA